MSNTADPMLRMKMDPLRAMIIATSSGIASNLVLAAVGDSVVPHAAKKGLDADGQARLALDTIIEAIIQDMEGLDELVVAYYDELFKKGKVDMIRLAMKLGME